MLIEPDVDVLLHDASRELGNKFCLITLVRKRSAHLRDGSPPLVDVPCRNPVSIALHEIYQGKVKSGTSKAEAPEVNAKDSEAAILAAILGHQTEPT